MQTLCQWDVQGEAASGTVGTVAELGEAKGGSAYAEKLVQAFLQDAGAIDARIARVTHGWDLSRLGPVERNVLRVAVVEMLSGSAPAKVAINEAIEIAKVYGGKASPALINGILDAVLRGMEAEKKGGA